MTSSVRDVVDSHDEPGSTWLVPTTLPRAWRSGEEVREHFRRILPALTTRTQATAVLGVCSTAPAEGASWVAAGLTVALAEAGHDVVLVDGHRLRPSQAAAFGTLPLPGPRQGHEPGAPLLSRITIVESGALSSAEAVTGLLRTVAERRVPASFVILDLEPLRETSQVIGLAGAVDRVVLVVEAERERREVVSRSVESLTRAGHQVAGAVLNKRIRRIPAFLYRWV